ncbi:MAG TPA: DUF4157 domain-containing protein [Saprospiraceae bacterium]|nr:DUF4157 domain-containing protein [Saprospiraceae bacterium]
MFAYKQSDQPASKAASSTQHGQQGYMPFFQPKLTVNQPGDEYEQEADRVADQVMRMPAVSLFGGGKGEAIQRSKMEEEKHVQRKEKPVPRFLGSESVVVQRKCSECEKEEKESAQRKESGGDAGGKAAPSIVSDVLSSGGGQALDTDTKRFMESRFGQDFSQVRVHTDVRAAESAEAIQARAYTSGRDVVFGAGEYRPESENGKRLLAHELVHVGQQAVSSNKISRVCFGGKWIKEYDGCSVPAAASKVLNVDKDNPAGGKDTQFGSKSGKHEGLPCDYHDDCYQSLLSDKDTCDIEMFKNMLNVCMNSKESKAVKLDCIEKAKLYFYGLQLGAHTAFYQRKYQLTKCYW